MSRGQRREEVAAEALVCAGLGGRVVERDDGSQPRMVDLVVEDRDGNAVAVEVTSTVARELVAQVAAMGRHAGARDQLRWSWTLQLRPRIRVHRADLVDLLRDLETRGIDRTAWWLLRWHDSTWQQLRDRGVEFAVAQRSGPGGVAFAVAAGERVQPVSLELAVQLAEEFLASPAGRGNVGKLAKARASERHLFLIIEDDNWAAATALRGDGVPQRAPTLPQGLTGLWMASTDQRAVWFDTQLDIWQEVALPPPPLVQAPVAGG